MKISEQKNKFKITLTRDDFSWEYFTAGGNGGQKQNKTASAVRCVHLPSGSVGISRDERSQLQNKRLAMERCIGTKAFAVWARMEVARIREKETGQISLEDKVNQDMNESNIKTEVLENGVWKTK